MTHFAEGPMQARLTRLKLENLEAREVPAAIPWTSESFDSLSLGPLPAKWTTWGSDGQSGFSVATSTTAAGNQVASNGNSARSGRAWLADLKPANLAISGSILADSLVPSQLIARGKNLDSNRPTYYAAQLVRGTQIDLVRVVDGSATTLGSLKTNAYLSGVWIDLTLIVRGTTLQVRAQRPDTGLWLSPNGDWQAKPMASLQVSDRAIQGKGFAGIGRAASHAGAISVDDLRIDRAPKDVRPPKLSLGRQPNGLVSGSIRIAATARDPGGIDRVEFLVDGLLIARRTKPGNALDLDTRNLANGNHTLMVRAWDRYGNLQVVEREFAVANASPLMPSFEQHQSHIQYAALAYNGLTIGDVEQQLLSDRVDLVVPNIRYASQIESIAPETPQLGYSNVSNLYLDLLTDWLGYADRSKTDRESAFYHVAEATPFSGDSPSSQPVNWFWNVGRGDSTGRSSLVDFTSKAETGTVGDVPFASAGDSLFVGYVERFSEIGFFLTQTAKLGWSGVIEYPSRVNRLGQPVGWKKLKITGDSTNTFGQSGRVYFNPPSDWKPTAIPGEDARLYYVRIRTTAGEANTAPIAARILGRDYVGAGTGKSGVIPAFDFTADRNLDGYLTDAEYARRQPGLDARFEYESRLFYPSYGQMRFVTNPTGAKVAQWAIDYHQRFLSERPLLDGIFMDNSGGRVPFGSTSLVEDTDTYAWDYAALLGGLSRAIAPGWLLANTSGGGSDAERIVGVVPATIEEFALRPLGHTWSQFLDVANTVRTRLDAANSSSTLILDTLSQGGSPTDNRTRMAALAYYYVLGDPDRTMLMMWGGEEPASSWSRHWFDAIAYDVGHPLGTWSEFAKGKDPTDGTLDYHVYGREYANALVLYKPLSYAAGSGAGTTANSSQTTHSLGGNYRTLNADGTLGPIINSVTLRNGDGALLIRS